MAWALQLDTAGKAAALRRALTRSDENGSDRREHCSTVLSAQLPSHRRLKGRVSGCDCTALLLWGGIFAAAFPAIVEVS
ncbi:MAG: hypothetical protein KME26_22470 [Oscillatoria princeps RMCB-10]|nr:hypothetical protein [Oscillatoria princeps RMCB-10]